MISGTMVRLDGELVCILTLCSILPSFGLTSRSTGLKWRLTFPNNIYSLHVLDHLNYHPSFLAIASSHKH